MAQCKRCGRPVAEGVLTQAGYDEECFECMWDDIQAVFSRARAQNLKLPMPMQ